jgi:3-oxoacyl-[acyl-carrier protein] reductase
VAADLTDPEQVRAVVRAVGGRTVDVVVNNAGAYVAAAPAREGEPDPLDRVADQWRATLDSNVLSAVLLTEALRPALRRPGGRVILLSSIAAHRGGGGPYSAAKAALHGWAFALATELGPEQITVNVVSPGYVAETEFFAGRMTPEGHAQRVSATLVGRAGEPADIAAAIRYLASPAAGFVTGQVLGVNGGSVLGR